MNKKTSRGAEPQGIIMLAIDKSNGRVVAAVSDFQADRYGGFKKKESQAIRARKALHAEIVTQCCSQLISKNISTYTREKIFEDLRANDQIETWTHEVGYSE